MTSTDGQRGEPPTFTLHATLLRKFTTASLPGEPHQCLTGDPQKAADIAARVAEPFIEQARSEVRKECAGILRDRSAEMNRASLSYGAAVARRLADEIDPLGPVMGAPAAGGTT